MTKRIVYLLLALILAVSLVTVTVSADSADDDLPYIELMDFTVSPLDGSQIGSFYVLDSYDFVGWFEALLGQISAFGYEITYSYVGNRPDVRGVSFGSFSDNDYNSRYVDGTNIGKIRGSFDGAVGSDFGISFWSSGCYVTVHSFRVFVVENYQVDLSAVLYGNGNSVTWYSGSSATVSTTGYGTIEIDSWRNYDVINVSATLGGYGITSVSARLIDNTSDKEIVIPFDLNYINLSDYDGEHENVLMTVSCDMRGVDPATAPDSTLIIGITTAVPSGSYGYIQPTSIYGSILMESPDEYLPWMKLIFNTLDASDISLSYIFQFTSDLYYNFNYFRQDFSKFTTSLNDSLSSYFGSLEQQISTSFSDFQDFFVQLEIGLYMEYLLPTLYDIRDKLAVSGTQQEAVQESAQGMTSAGSQLADLGGQISAATPDISASDISVDFNSTINDIVVGSKLSEAPFSLDTAYLITLTVFEPVPIQMFIAFICVFALAGFLLFGKRVF